MKPLRRLSKFRLHELLYGRAGNPGYLWPNHVELHRFYQHWLTEDHCGRYLEIGPGHGYYFMQAARTGKFTHYQGVDISPSSVELAHNIMSRRYLRPLHQLQCGFGRFFHLGIRLQHYDVIVMAEVLEHVETRKIFLTESATYSPTTAKLISTLALIHLQLTIFSPIRMSNLYSNKLNWQD